MFLTGRTALVTGAGRGIGRAVAERLAREGARVVVAGRTRAELDAAAAALSGVALPVDVADRASIAAALDALRRDGVHVDVLVNNAGAAESAPLDRTSDELWDRMMAVNAGGAFALCRALIPPMIAAGWGRVINVASNAGLTGYAYTAAYCASKHAVVGLTRAIAMEVARTPVTVNAVCPGWVDTQLLSELGRPHRREDGPERGGGAALARGDVAAAAAGRAGGGGARRGLALRRGCEERARAGNRDRRRAGDVMSDSSGIRVVEVPGWPKPKGYANGVITEGRRLLHVAGQVGWNAEMRFESDDFARQFAQALDNVLAVVRAAGGGAEDVVRMTVYVTDLAAYRASQRALGPIWRERFGRHFPVMALVGVAGLVEASALVEIEAVAALPEGKG